MSNGESIATFPFSASQGGYPVLVDDASVPGKVLHYNESTENNDTLEVRIVNPNPAAVSLFYVIGGPGLTPPIARDAMDRVDIDPTPTGQFPALTELPQIVGAGYSLYLSADTPAGSAPLLVYGHVHRHRGIGAIVSGGHGGIIQRSVVPLSDLAINAWQTIPFDAAMVANPINMTIDIANNRLSFQAQGVWYFTFYGSITFDRNQQDDRDIYTRVYNETLSGPVTADPWPMVVEIGTRASGWSYAVQVEIATSQLNQWIRFELGGSPIAFSGIQLWKAGVGLVRISDTI